jgi:hypothetical protein
VRYHLRWLASERDDKQQPKQPLVVRVERRITSQRNSSNVYILAVPWQQPDDVRRDLQELRHVTKHAIERALVQVGATGCPQGSGGNPVPPVGEVHCPEVAATGCREESSPRNSHRNTPPSPPLGKRQQRQGAVVADVDQALGEQDSDGERGARMLAEAFYRGLGADTAAVTPPLRKRDLAIARDLVAVGATPLEAEGYAREMCGKSMRIAPVDLRSFERERLGWQARCRDIEHQERRGVDRTGQPPSWQTEQSATAIAHAAEFTPVVTRSPDRPLLAANGEQLRQTLRAVLLGQNG